MADQRAALDPGVVFRHDVRLVPSGASPGSRSATRARSGDLRQELQQHAAGAPAMARAAVAGDQLLGDRETHARRDLLGAQEIFVRGVFERAALERDHALVAAHVGALVDGHGEMAVAEQIARRRSCRPRSRPRRALVRSARRRAPCRACVKSTTSMRTGPSVCVCRMKRPSILSAEPSSTASTTASPSSFATGAG